MSVLVKYTSGSTYTLSCSSVSRPVVQDIAIDHIGGTDQSNSRALGLEWGKVTIEGDVTDKTVCNWDDIVAVSFDAGTSYQTCRSEGVLFGDDQWSGIYPYTLSLMVAPLRYGTTHSATAIWGWATINVPAATGSGLIRISYQGPTRYWPLQGSLASVDGVGITFLRSAAEVYKGISYSAGTPIYDGGLVMDTGNRASASITAKSLVMRLLSVRYPSPWIAGGTAPNILTANQSSAETNTTGTAATNGTVTRVTSTSYVGGASFLDTVAGSGDSLLTLTGTAVTAGLPYAFSAYVKATAAAGRQWKMRIEWFTAGAASLGVQDSPVSAVSSSWTRLWVCGVAPATAATAKVSVVLVSALVNELLYEDAAMLEAMTATQYLWQSALNSCYIDVAAGAIKWTDGTTTISRTIDWQAYTQGATLDVVAIDDTTDTLVVVQGGTAVTATGTLAALAWGTLNIGSNGAGNELMAAVSHIVAYPYALTAGEYSALHLTIAPLTWGGFSIAYRSSGTVTIDSNGRLLDALGVDITACMAGVVPTAVATLAMTDGLAARWSVSIDDTWRV